jgi:hypothetical protein
VTGDLINTLESPGEFDALTRLRVGEPYFPLVGRDRLAPPLIYDWADRNRRRALAEFSEGKITKENRDREMRKSTQAEMIAASMVEYKNKWVADHRDEQRPTTYSGHELPEDTKRADALQSARVRAASAINGAAAELNDLCELLAEGPIEERAKGDLYRLALADIKALSDEVAPRRVISQASAPLLDGQANG